MNAVKERKVTRSKGTQVQITVSTKNYEATIGDFKLLSTELQYLIFQKCSVAALGRLAMTSKGVRDLVEGYIEYMCANKRMRFYENRNKETVAEALQWYKIFGTLMKRVTCLYCTQKRMAIVLRTIFKMLPCTKSLQQCIIFPHCTCSQFLGRFLHALMKGWDPCEWSKVLKIAEKVVLTKVGKGTLQCTGTELRQFYKCVFLDQYASDCEKVKWLEKIFQPLTVGQVTRLMRVLFVRTRNGNDNWAEVGLTPVNNFDDIVFEYGQLAFVIRILHEHSSAFRGAAICHYLKNMTEKPSRWFPGNTAGLLMLCGPQITALFLKEYNCKYTLFDFGQVIVHIAALTMKNWRSIKWIMDILKEVSVELDSPNLRKRFVKGILTAFQYNLLYRNNDPDDQGSYRSMVNALFAFVDRSAQLA